MRNILKEHANEEMVQKSERKSEKINWKVLVPLGYLGCQMHLAYA